MRLVAFGCSFTHYAWPTWADIIGHELGVRRTKLPERSIAVLEEARNWPKGMLFHREQMPSRLERSAWGSRMRSTLDGANIVFLDPDNGIGAATRKPATVTEIRLLPKPGRAIVCISFPGRNLKNDVLLRACMIGRPARSMPKRGDTPHQCFGALLLSSYVQRQRWFTVVDADAHLIARARIFGDALTSIPRVKAYLYSAARAAGTLAEPIRPLGSGGCANDCVAAELQNKRADRV